jgi:hypothetical protein
MGQGVGGEGVKFLKLEAMERGQSPQGSSERVCEAGRGIDAGWLKADPGGYQVGDTFDKGVSGHGHCGNAIGSRHLSPPAVRGAVNPPVNSRLAAPATPLSYVVANTTATIDGASANVSFAGLAPGFVGLCQVNIDIPVGLPAGQHNLVVTIGGIQSNQVTVNTK